MNVAMWVRMVAIVGTLVLGPQAVADGASPTVVLVVDASASQAGANITAVRHVARQVLENFPDDTQLGLVTFNSRKIATIEPTTDHALTLARLETVVPRGGTPLYDALLTALGMASGKNARIVVVTDGYDSASSATKSEVVRALMRAGVATDVVAVAARDVNLKVMKSFTVASGGRLYQAATAQDLGTVFQRALEQTVPIASPNPTPSITQQTPEPSPQSTVSSQADTWLQRLGSSPWTLSLVAGLATAFYAYLLGTQFLLRRRQNQIAEAINLYDAGTPSSVTSSQVRVSPLIEVPTRKLKSKPKQRVSAIQSRYLPWLSDRLEKAGTNLSARRWVEITLATGVVLSVMAELFIHFWPLAVILAAIATAVGQHIALEQKIAMQRRKFEVGLADFLTLIASGLRSGMSFAQAIDSAAQEGSGLVERQIRRALGEVRVGATIEAALGRVADRMESDDLRWTLAALQIQRDIGGNLSRILETAAMTIRVRAEVRREIRALSAEGRLSAYILLALPIGIFLYLVGSRRDYVEILWTQPIGIAMLTVFVLAVTAGWIWIRNIVAVEV